MEKNLCPCGKDVTDLRYQYHRYRCPEREKKACVADASRSRPAGPKSINKVVKSDKPPTRPVVARVTPKQQLKQTALERQSDHPCGLTETSSASESQRVSLARPKTSKSQSIFQPDLRKNTPAVPKSSHDDCKTAKPLSQNADKFQSSDLQLPPKRSQSPTTARPSSRTPTAVSTSRSPTLKPPSTSWSAMMWRYLGWPDVEVTYQKSEKCVPPHTKEADDHLDDTISKSKNEPKQALWKTWWTYFWPLNANKNIKKDVHPETNTQTCAETITPEHCKTEKCEGQKQTVESKQTTSGCRPKQNHQIPQRSTKMEKAASRGTERRRIIDKTELDDIVESMFNEGVILRSNNREKDVKAFFDQEVKLSQNEITKVREHFNILRDKIISKLNEETKLDCWDPRNAGSSADGTKVSHLDEMDCIMSPGVSKHMKAVFDESCVPGFCKVKVVGDVKDTDVGMFLDGDFLNSRKFKNFVFQKLEDIVEGDRKLEDARKFADTLSFAIKYTGIPTENGMITVDVDFVPSIRISAWPEVRYARDIIKVIGDTGQARRIKNWGFNATPKFCASGRGADLLWQVSFSYAEKQITKYGDKKCWKPVMRTLKRIVDIARGDVDSCSSSKGNQLTQIQRAVEYARRRSSFSKSLRLTTYQIRTLMWTLRYDLTAGGHVWIEDTQANRLRLSLMHFQKMMTGEAIFPHFFIPAIRNIMDGIPEDERKYLYIVAKASEIIFSNS